MKNKIINLLTYLPVFPILLVIYLIKVEPDYLSILNTLGNFIILIFLLFGSFIQVRCMLSGGGQIFKIKEK